MSPTQFAARTLADSSNPRSVASRLRRRRIAALVDLVRDAHARYGQVRILDIGGTRSYWQILSRSVLDRYDVHITIVNVSHPAPGPCADDARFEFLAGDGCDLGGCFADGAFHVVHSNSVIEHVGDWYRMMDFAREIRRLAPAYFVQTPNFWFPIEPHFMTPLFHWLPVPVRVALVRRFTLGHRARRPDVAAAVEEVQSVHLLDRRMLGRLFPDARVCVERLLGCSKSLIAVRGFAAQRTLPRSGLGDG